MHWNRMRCRVEDLGSVYKACQRYEPNIIYFQTILKTRRSITVITVHYVR